MIQKMKSRKGFTLIEMLVVIAIIAVLVAIIIPVVGDSTEKAKEAADAANIRAAIAEVTTNGLTGGTSAPVTVNIQQSGAFDKAFKSTDQIGGYSVGDFKDATTVVVSWKDGDVEVSVNNSVIGDESGDDNQENGGA